MRVTAATFLLLAAVVPNVSAWDVWVNWKANCGGNSYNVKGEGSSGCQITNVPSDGKPPQSLTLTNSLGCTAFVYSDRNCGREVGRVNGNSGTSCSGNANFQSFRLAC